MSHPQEHHPASMGALAAHHAPPNPNTGGAPAYTHHAGPRRLPSVSLASADLFDSSVRRPLAADTVSPRMARCRVGCCFACANAAFPTNDDRDSLVDADSLSIPTRSCTPSRRLMTEAPPTPARRITMPSLGGRRCRIQARTTASIAVRTARGYSRTISV